jgi:hypothetical protein
MASASYSFDARDVSITWGEVIIDGTGDGNFVTIAYNTDNVTLHKGAQGHMTAVLSSDDSGRVTVVLSQSSPTNDRLSGFAALQRRAGVGLIKKPIQIKHINGTTIAIGAEAWIVKAPDTVFGAEHQNREWMFEIPHLELFIGGSTR